ncbi:MAG TPA: hypothetical protein VMV56_03875 [Williamwhitmania sp.]|nr:hypothetical protein [Williamwhitmania sp.]
MRELMLGSPSAGFKKESGKIRKISLAYVNGENVASKEVPQMNDVLEVIISAFENRSD